MILSLCRPSQLHSNLYAAMWGGSLPSSEMMSGVAHDDSALGYPSRLGPFVETTLQSPCFAAYGAAPTSRLIVISPIYIIIMANNEKSSVLDCSH